ncbi:hypothetical protein Acid345_3419 [Candidatus Koribacter versatilis Ellin345]|uniref:Uncharacterized protein n=1 Tax=Koribacter versatilis (strain Ellin345) TaxID=204669 RepID=Q1IL30_KORVE|nr:hypothetical protein [Candidatus Koribacter versatilis]ABF42420.1 hypothetical protein Acid345_3419 [Candidatus Koribacter versatilis Ellin345]
MMIVVSRDYDGLRIAALELMNEEFQGEDRDRLARRAKAGAANSEAMLAEAAPARSLADGYYVRADYLFWLDDVLRATTIAQMSAAEVHGLNAVRRARDQFRMEHPNCPHCGAMNERIKIICRKCGKRTSTDKRH